MANTFDTETLFSYLDLSIINCIILNLLISHFFMNVSSFPFYVVYISQLIHFARVCSYVGNFNEETIF